MKIFKWDWEQEYQLLVSFCMSWGVRFCHQHPAGTILLVSYNSSYFLDRLPMILYQLGSTCKYLGFVFTNLGLQTSLSCAL
jgi:hypothetical protein